MPRRRCRRRNLRLPHARRLPAHQCERKRTRAKVMGWKLMKEREAGVPTTKMSRSRGVRWDGGAGGLAVAVVEVGAEEKLSAGQGQAAGQEVSAGLEEPGGEAGAARGLAEGQRGALAWRSPAEGQRGALAWRSLTEGRWPGGARRRGLEECCLADGRWRRKTMCFQTRGISVLLCVFTWSERNSQRQLFRNGGSIYDEVNYSI